jgi:outer membrane receptor protein involved in Fe transport
MHRIFYIFFFLPLYCFSQNCIVSGIVTDASQNTPLPNASILLVNTGISCTSVSDGSFSLTGISSGNYTLNVSFVGYQKYQKKIELKNGQNLFLKISLKDTSITTKEILVKAFKEKDLLEQVGRINIITRSSINLLPVQGINEIIDYSPGINMSNTTGFFSSKAIVTMHGLPANDQSRTLVILDGIPLNKSDEGSVNWNMINKGDIEQVKIIKGPGPAKYGSGAMGGVIEITSKKPDKKFDGDMSMSYGTYNTASTNINLSGIKKCTGKLSDFYWGLNGLGRLSDGYITIPDSFRTIEDTVLVPVFLKELNTSVKTGCDFSNNQNAEIQLGYFDDIRGNGVKVFDYYGAFSKHSTYKGIFKYTGTTGFFKWNANIFIVSENYNRIYEYMNEGEYRLYEADATRKDKGTNAELSFYKFDKHEITGGINVKSGSVDGTDTYYTSTDIIHNAAKMDNYAAFVQDEMVFLNEKIRINAGLRYDFANFYDALFTIDDPSYSLIFYEEFENYTMQSRRWDALCPRFSAQYMFSKTNRIYFSAAKGFRAPILDDMCRTGKKKGGFKVANPELKPEHIYSYECGTDFKITKNISADASLYYSIGRDFMYYTSTGDSVNMGYTIAPIFKKQNIGKVEIYGLETELKYEIRDSLNFFINYSFSHAQIIEHNITNAEVDSNLTGKYLTDIPNHKAGFGLIWSNRYFNASVLFKYVGKTWINDYNIVDNEYMKTDRFPQYFIINIKFEKEFLKHFSAALGIENMLNKSYIDSDLEKCPGRFITGSVKYCF